MNKPRRKALEKVINIIEEAKGELEMLRDEEQEYMDNMPENLADSDRYNAADSAVSNMDDAINELEEAVSSIREYREGWTGRRSTYKCRNCGNKFQVDTRAALPEHSKYCVDCGRLPLWTFQNARGKIFQTRCMDLELATLRAWQKDKSYRLVTE